jgi:phosphoribosylcarboxyaminoimidazole (NCAIR) mutase
MKAVFASPYRFNGLVVATTNVDRTATVRTDDGRDVIVLGSEVDGPNAATTVDRTYQVGVRYEFDPVNDSSPYQDNICTTTHPLAHASVADAPAGGSAHLPGSGGGRIAFWAIGGLVVALALGILGAVARRVRSPRR